MGSFFDLTPSLPSLSLTGTFAWTSASFFLLFFLLADPEFFELSLDYKL